MMSILSHRCCREPKYIASLDLFRDQLEFFRRDVMALIDDELPVVGNTIIDDIVANQTLPQRHIDKTGGLFLSAPHDPEILGRNIEKHRQSAEPLIQDRLAVNDNERIDTSLGNHLGAQHGFAETRRQREHSQVMSLDRPEGRLLVRVQSA